jgi:phospholipid/cholesterol/gamma-HCH transport system substrate-binding protein
MDRPVDPGVATPAAARPRPDPRASKYVRRLRHAEELTGLLVIAAMVVFFAAVLQAGVLRDWFRPVSTLRVVLPEGGGGGLSVGADVEVLGTHAGKISRVVIEPDRQMYAVADIDDQARAFIHRDSHAVIRRRFGVAGAAYLDILRGSGPPLDWTYAVVNATTERAPTETVGAVLDEVRQKVFPILDDLGRSAHSLAAMTEHAEHGEGNVGRLMMDDRLIHAVEKTIDQVREITTQLDAVARDARKLADQASGGEVGVPALLRRVDQLLVSLQTVTRDLAKASPRLPQIARNMESGTSNLPSLLTQTQVTAQQLEALLTQLRGMWLLGGGSAAPASPRRLPTSEVRP